MQPDLSDYTKHPPMVRWFRPYVLVDAGRRAIISALFGEFADRRLVHAALDPADEKELLLRCEPHVREERGGGTPIVANTNGEVWIDYVADIGDGFDSTYAIAYLLAQKFLQMPGAGALPRGQALIMGGDQVYPVATRAEYDRRMKTPYSYAFPNSKSSDGVHPPLYLIPGNHDWYDGLALFLAKFCRGIKSTSLGSWRMVQHRSYFALKLPFDWWVWGIDTGLTADIDMPQDDFFRTIARHMPANAKIILCNSVPSWLKAEQSTKKPAKKVNSAIAKMIELLPQAVKAELFSKAPEKEAEYARGLDHIAGIVKELRPSAKIMAVLSGDQHHYSRYAITKTGTQFVTAGGGGAFLHPTHALKDELHVWWMGERQVLSLKTNPDGSHEPTDKAACYPSREQSRRLALGNWKFPLVNWDFSLIIGCIYLVMALFLNAGRTSDNLWHFGSLIFWGVILAIWMACHRYAEGHSKSQKFLIGTLHALCHIGLVLVLFSLLPPFTEHNFLFSMGMILGGLGGGLIWGLYLIVVSYRYKLHNNDAFSAMRLDSYKNFLRMRIAQDQLTIYPIGLTQSPKRNDWKANPQAQKGNQDEPVIIPVNPLNPILIEEPIIIRASS